MENGTPIGDGLLFYTLLGLLCYLDTVERTGLEFEHDGTLCVDWEHFSLAFTHIFSEAEAQSDARLSTERLALTRAALFFSNLSTLTNVDHVSS